MDDTEQRTTSPAEAPSLPLGNLPTWGGAAAAFLAAWAAYARRKRLQHAIEAAQERAERAARRAAQRARAAALIAAVALDQARRRLTHPTPAEETDDETPPLPRQTGLLVDGEVPLDQAASGRTPQPGPPRPDGSYTPHGLRKGYVTERPVDLASWKQADYGQMAHAHEVAEAGVHHEEPRHCFHWEALLNPLEAVDTAKILFVPVGATLMGIVFLGITATLCETAIGCALAPLAVFNAGIHFVAAGLSLKGAKEHLKSRWREITHCQEHHE